MIKKYLTEEEQFKKILNNEEIDRIENLELQNIRSKYWGLRHNAFQSESKIPDQELDIVLDAINDAEQKELDNFKRKIIPFGFKV